jgi:flagellar biosynthesis GTPase FlhF
MDEMEARASRAEQRMAAVLAENKSLSDHVLLGEAAFNHIQSEMERRLREGEAASKAEAEIQADRAKQEIETRDEQIRALERELEPHRKAAAEKAAAENAAKEKAALEKLAVEKAAAEKAASEKAAAAAQKAKANAAAAEKLVEAKRLVEAAGGHMATSGELGVSLIWDADCDLDLRCTLPNGSVCSYSNSNVGCATLDVDRTSSTRGKKVENIFLKEPGRSRGSYRFQVHYYSGSVQVPWTAVVSDRGKVYTKTGVLSSSNQGSLFDIETLNQA